VRILFLALAGPGLIATALLARAPVAAQAAPPAAPRATAQAPASTGSESRPSFADWLDGVRREALDRGIAPSVVDEALGSVDEPQPTVIERDRSQAETVLSLETYIARQLTRSRIRTGRRMFAAHKTTLDRVAADYGVPAYILAGVWGIESNFGRFSGVRPTIPALATLAWDPRRATFFRQELFDALEILNRGDIDLPRMKGSWAGAMGQPQFMPSSYLEFAVDFDGDGQRNIWSSTPDVVASIGNYLKGHGWTEGQRWGREVRISRETASRIRSRVARRDGSCQATRDMSVAVPLDEWEAMGVRTVDGGRLPSADFPASLVSGATRQFLVYPNYDALLQYNCAHAYALSVALLGETVASVASRR
jgi:membrane-bound lytic murein transglycosylase B